MVVKEEGSDNFLFSEVAVLGGNIIDTKNWSMELWIPANYFSFVRATIANFTGTDIIWIYSFSGYTLERDPC